MSSAKDYKKRKFVVCGVSFDSINDFAEKTNSYSTTIRRWLDEKRFDKLEDRYNASLS